MTQSDKLTRRQFIRRAFIILGGGALAACGADVQVVEIPWQTPTAYQALQSPVPPEQTATPEGEALTELKAFLALSSALTGFDNLNPELGRVYLNSLNNHADVPMDVTSLAEQAGVNSDSPPQSAADLEERGIFEQEDTRTLADTIITYWYTGIYATPDGDTIATYVDSLAWKSVSQIKPRTICGAPGFWATNPEHPV